MVKSHFLLQQYISKGLKPPLAPLLNNTACGLPFKTRRRTDIRSVLQRVSNTNANKRSQSFSEELAPVEITAVDSATPLPPGTHQHRRKPSGRPVLTQRNHATHEEISLAAERNASRCW